MPHIPPGFNKPKITIATEHAIDVEVDGEKIQSKLVSDIMETKWELEFDIPSSFEPGDAMSEFVKHWNSINPKHSIQ